ncbi:MAG: CvpA family protein [Clostridia bacterium]|nr:CvpA family protein [Clostridia bacterium]
MNTIDFICLGIIIIFTIIGASKGIISFVLRLVITLISAVGARLAAVPLTDMLYGAVIKDKVTVQLFKLLPSGSVSGGVNALINTITEALPSAAVKIANALHLLPESGEVIGSEVLSVSQIEADYIRPIVTKVLIIITTLTVFVIASVILNMLAKTISKKFFEKKDGAVNTANRIAGGLFGVVRGAIPAGCLCALLLLVAPLISNEKLTFLVEGSYFCGLISQLFN